ncbi:spore coat protein GerQ [Metasolibacillus meyeri]|uniref:Spore coat protein GerQ n=2 Tax=Metasolibacillus meyeri TaxID=1071052 RepID=A0AAW9NNM2_9BACL|nr:spore coat protein GerQ [Metasolibacillus meyeri]MEC1176919.1 spore coat protein GerQ [Metasolibacillus meyeri]
MTYYWTPPTQQMPSPPRREESYIENILRLNRGKPGVFYFSFDNAVNGQNTKAVRGVVEAAGRDHAIIRELKTDHRFLFPMIYFDYAEFDEELAYFTQTP